MDTYDLNGKKYQWFKRMNVYQWREIRQFVYERDKGLCQYCKAQVELNECHIHHVFELNQGGTNHPTNLKTACKRCHKNKHPFMKDVREKLHDEINRAACKECTKARTA